MTRLRLGRAEVRFRVPRGFRVVDAWAEQNILYLCRRLNAPPDLAITTTSYDTPVESISEGLRRQREAYAKRLGRVLIVQEALLLEGVEAGHLEVRDELEGFVDVTYFRAIGGNVWVAGYRKSPGQEIERIDRAAREVARTLEVEAPPHMGEWLELPEAGYAIRGPKGWERQHLFGQWLWFAPGVGYRARIATSSEREKPWGNVLKRSIRRVLDMKFIYRPFEVLKEVDIRLAGVKGRRLDWRGYMPMKELWVRGMHLFLPKGRRGAELSLIAAEEQFKDWEVDGLATADALRWISGAGKGPGSPPPGSRRSRRR